MRLATLSTATVFDLAGSLERVAPTERPRSSTRVAGTQHELVVARPLTAMVAWYNTRVRSPTGLVQYNPRVTTLL
jgi:hypothetical protein